MRFFWLKIRKFSKLEKLDNIMNKQSILKKKKRFHLLKRHLYQNGKAQNMPVVAGHLVMYLLSRFPWLKRTSLFPLQLQVLDSNNLNFVELIRSFSAFFENGDYSDYSSRLKIVDSQNVEKLQNYSKQKKLTSRPSKGIFSILWIVCIFST